MEFSGTSARAYVMAGNDEVRIVGAVAGMSVYFISVSCSSYEFQALAAVGLYPYLNILVDWGTGLTKVAVGHGQVDGSDHGVCQFKRSTHPADLHRYRMFDYKICVLGLTRSKHECNARRLGPTAGQSTFLQN